MGPSWEVPRIRTQEDSATGFYSGTSAERRGARESLDEHTAVQIALQHTTIVAAPESHPDAPIPHALRARQDRNRPCGRFHLQLSVR